MWWQVCALRVGLNRSQNRNLRMERETESDPSPLTACCVSMVGTMLPEAAEKNQRKGKEKKIKVVQELHQLIPLSKPGPVMTLLTRSFIQLLDLLPA